MKWSAAQPKWTARPYWWPRRCVQCKFKVFWEWVVTKKIDGQRYYTCGECYVKAGVKMQKDYYAGAQATGQVGKTLDYPSAIRLHPHRALRTLSTGASNYS